MRDTIIKNYEFNYFLLRLIIMQIVSFKAKARGD